MKNLYHLQTLLVVIFSLLNLSMAFGQTSNPQEVYLRSSGSSYIDQFPASAPAYAYGIVEDVSSQIGSAQIVLGTESNTLKVVFTPNVGAVGSTDLIVQFYTLSSPEHPVTRSYRFIVAPEIVIAGEDQYVADKNAIDIPLAVLANDSATLQSLTLSAVSVANNGSATFNPSGDTIYFTPETDFEGETWIQYIACDTAGNCAPGKAHILVRDPNLQDELTFRKYLLNREELKVLTPFPEFSIDVAPSHGTLDSTSSFSWIYIPDEDYTGNDTFKLGLSGLVVREYILTIYEKGYNVQAIDDKFYVRPGLSVTFNVTNNDLLDFDISSNTNPSKGTLNNQGNGVFTYTPLNGYRGVDKFTYTSCYSDTVYCETATVFIHVTDLEPENTFSYALQTSESIPLVIDHPVTFTDFSYIVSVQPAHGNFVFYDGLQTINLPCDTIEGYNVLVYQPAPGYTGPDHFEYYFCIQPTNICYQVKVDMNVVSAPESESCPCVVDCVWPGDADQDGRVDMSDLLAIGYQLGATGTERGYADPGQWFGQHPASWSFDSDQEKTGYLDANGDGKVTQDDIATIDNYYYRAHDIVVKDVQQKLPYQFSLIPVQFELDSGATVILDVALGAANKPVIDLKGTKFSVNVPPVWMDSSSVTVDFHNDSWLAQSNPYVSLYKVPWNGRIDAGFSKAEGTGASGFGIIGTITFIITDDFEGFKIDNDIIEIPLTLHSGAVMDGDGLVYDIEGTEIVLRFKIGDSDNDRYQMLVYPNPAGDYVNISMTNQTEIQSVSVVDPQGRVIKQTDDIQSQQHQENITSLPAGLYYLQVKHTYGVKTQLLSVIR